MPSFYYILKLAKLKLPLPLICILRCLMTQQSIKLVWLRGKVCRYFIVFRACFIVIIVREPVSFVLDFRRVPISHHVLF